MRQVVVTGVGVVAPNGVGKEAFWSACVNGQSGVRPIQSFDTASLPVHVAGEVPDLDISPFLPTAYRKNLKLMGRAVRLGVAAAGLAVQDSGLELSRENPERVGVVMGSGLVPMDLTEIAPIVAGAVNGDGCLPADRLGNAGKDALFPLWILKHLPNITAAHISLVHGLQGPNSTVVTACVAGTQAIGEGFRLIARGDVEVMLAGGADSRLDPLLLLAYSALGALSPGQGRSAARPAGRTAYHRKPCSRPRQQRRVGILAAGWGY